MTKLETAPVQAAAPRAAQTKAYRVGSAAGGGPSPRSC